jgi:replicative superfamily II helicase
MPFLAAFIGVNKHQSQRIPELTGATRDAKALWALFTDSVPHIQSRLLIDGQATTAAIRQSLGDTVGSAGPDDTALFFFAGHGTEAHQLVPYDTQIEAIEATTIPMDELTALLSTSKARAVIVILDCCFSGGATARVLQDIPVPRGRMTTISHMQGKGRVIMAASRDDQSAYEMKGHGLFTYALIQSFIHSPSGIDLGTLMSETGNRVRAVAQRYGWDQTPMFFNLIEGGLTFPPLQPGRLYLTAFPNTALVRIDHRIESLAVFGLSPNIISEWSARFPGGLNAMQLETVNELRILDGESALIVAPTSSGKTFAGEMAAAKAIMDGRKAVFLLPYKALVSEKYEDFTAFYTERLGQRVIRCTGDYADDTTQFIQGKYDIALLTYELFLNLAVSVPSLLSKIGIVVLDEAQFITDSTRGIVVELILTNLLTAQEKGLSLQLIALSAVIGDVNYLDEWLGCKLLLTHERPVPLLEGALDRHGVFQYLAQDGTIQIKQLLPTSSIFLRKTKPEKQDVLIPLVQKLASQGEQVLVFRNQKGSSEGCAIYLANELRFPPAQAALQQLSDQDPSSSTVALRKALSGGTAFHNSDLTREERIIVERAFRENNGAIRALVATTTVAAGVNTPASVVIIAEQFFYGEVIREFTVAEYKNMAGRAGRLGKTEHGQSILLAGSSYERERLFQKYVLGKPEPVRSSFESDHLETWILRLLTQVRQTPREYVIQLLSRTYGGYLANRSNPDWKEQIENDLIDILQKMEELELIEEEEDNIRLSLLGKACGSSNLSFKAAMQLIRLLKRVGGKLTGIQIMGLIQGLDEVGGYTSIFKKGTKEATWPGVVTSKFGHTVSKQLQWGATDLHDYHARCKRASILWEWINGSPIEAIERRFSASPYTGTVGAGDIRGYADRTRFYLRSAFQIASLLSVTSDGAGVDTLLKQLETGLPEDALGLLDLPVRLGRGEYLALYTMGYTTPEQVQSLPREELLKYVNQSQAEYIQRANN